MTKNPWEGIKTPPAPEIQTRLIDMPRCPSGVKVCWAMTSNGNRALYVLYPASVGLVPLPKLKVINITVRKPNSNTIGILIELTADEIREQFLHLCEDVISVIGASSTKLVCSSIQLCLEKWRYLLSMRGQLSAEAQKGLIAELLFLKRVVLAVYPFDEAIGTWQGPMRDKRDFSFGTTFVEVKSNRGSQSHRIKVSSEDQLATNAGERLFLYVVGLNDTPQGGITLADIVREVRSLAGKSITGIQELNMKLASAGFRDDEDYSAHRWAESEAVAYEVSEGFPRIQAKDLLHGIDKVSYQVDLSYCPECIVPIELVSSAIAP